MKLDDLIKKLEQFKRVSGTGNIPVVIRLLDDMDNPYGDPEALLCISNEDSKCVVLGVNTTYDSMLDLDPDLDNIIREM